MKATDCDLWSGQTESTKTLAIKAGKDKKWTAVGTPSTVERHLFKNHNQPNQSKTHEKEDKIGKKMFKSNQINFKYKFLKTFWFQDE